MVAAAAPSSTTAHRGLSTATCRACPERRPRGGDRVGPGRSGLCGRREAGGEERRARPGLAVRCLGSRGSLCLGGMLPLSGSLEREKGGGGDWLRVRCAAEPRGARAAAGAYCPDRVNRRTGPVPGSVAAATLLALGTGVLGDEACHSGC